MLDAIDLGLIDDFDLKIAELDVNVIQIFRSDNMIGESLVDIVVSEVALLLGETDEFLDFFA